MVRPLWQLLLEDPPKLTCDECFAVLEYYSELLAWGGADLLPAVMEHLQGCPECRVEHQEALRRLEATCREEQNGGVEGSVVGGEGSDPLRRDLNCEGDTAMTDRSALREAILTRLSAVIDPETGVDVVRMRLIEDLTVNEAGVVRYTFRPSSPLRPLAVSLALSIRQAVAEVEGVAGQEIGVVGYIKDEELNTMLRELAG